MYKILSITFLAIVLFAGCSSKKYFEPQESESFPQDTKNLSSSIIDLNSNGATLEDYSYISEKGMLNNIKEGYNFLNFSDKSLITANDNASLNIQNDKMNKTIAFDKNVISASKSSQLLAFGSIDNSISLYDLNTDQILFKEYLQPSSINNIRIANPIFLNSVILFPTLDGKVVIVDIKNKAIVKTINIDPQGDVNNIIFLEEINDTLVAATSKKVFTFVEGKPNIKDIEVQSIIIKDSFIYVATLEGEIIKFDRSLNKINSKKFKFAKINALAFGSSLYALESEGYLIEISPNFKKTQVYDLSFNNEEKVIAIDNKIYFDDEYIELK